MSNTQDKKQAVPAFIDAAKRHTAGIITRNQLDAVLDELAAIASRKYWWSATEYPAPTGDELQARYMIHDEPDNTYALYLNELAR